MRRTFGLGSGLLMICWLTAMAWPQAKAKSPAEKPVESEHRQGPNGLEGWTLNSSISDDPGGDDKYPFTLVIARNGREIRRIEGEPFVWRWIFWADGKQIAYESGPLHFGMSCILADIETGRRLGDIDCFQELPDNAPDWAVELESAQ